MDVCNHILVSKTSAPPVPPDEFYIWTQSDQPEVLNFTTCVSYIDIDSIVQKIVPCAIHRYLHGNSDTKSLLEHGARKDGYDNAYLEGETFIAPE